MASSLFCALLVVSLCSLFVVTRGSISFVSKESFWTQSLQETTNAEEEYISKLSMLVARSDYSPSSEALSLCASIFKISSLSYEIRHCYWHNDGSLVFVLQRGRVQKEDFIGDNSSNIDIRCNSRGLCPMVVGIDRDPNANRNKPSKKWKLALLHNSFYDYCLSPRDDFLSFSIKGSTDVFVDVVMRCETYKNVIDALSRVLSEKLAKTSMDTSLQYLKSLSKRRPPRREEVSAEVADLLSIVDFSNSSIHSISQKQKTRRMATRYWSYRSSIASTFVSYALCCPDNYRSRPLFISTIYRAKNDRNTTVLEYLGNVLDSLYKGFDTLLLSEIVGIDTRSPNLHVSREESEAEVAAKNRNNIVPRVMRPLIEKLVFGVCEKGIDCTASGDMYFIVSDVSERRKTLELHYLKNEMLYGYFEFATPVPRVSTQASAIHGSPNCTQTEDDPYCRGAWYRAKTPILAYLREKSGQRYELFLVCYLIMSLFVVCAAVNYCRNGYRSSRERLLKKRLKKEKSKSAE